MAIMRQTPKCFLCGKPIAEARHKDESKVSPMQRLIGDTFIGWKPIKHECDGNLLDDQSGLILKNVMESACKTTTCENCVNYRLKADARTVGTCLLDDEVTWNYSKCGKFKSDS